MPEPSSVTCLKVCSEAASSVAPTGTGKVTSRPNASLTLTSSVVVEVIVWLEPPITGTTSKVWVPPTNVALTWLSSVGTPAT